MRHGRRRASLQRLAAWTITALRNQHQARLAGYRLLLALGSQLVRPAGFGRDLSAGLAHVLWRKLTSRRIIPVWLWKRWLAEQPARSSWILRDSTTLFDATRSQPQLRSVGLPVDETAQVCLLAWAPVLVCRTGGRSCRSDRTTQERRSATPNLQTCS
jgi:hypothetical protein